MNFEQGSNKDDREKISDVTGVFDGEEEDKVLGVVWSHRTDKLLFKVKADSFKIPIESFLFKAKLH